MKKSIKKLLSVCLVFCLVVTQMIFAGTASAAEVSKQQRLSGSDRYKTAVAISQKGWKSSNYAVIARGDEFADALCAGPLAKKFGAPILLTQPNELNADVLTELKRLGVKNIFIAGGPGAVSANVESSIKSAGIANVERLYGADRFETSVKIAEKLGTVKKIVLATGMDFPDALSISAIASKSGMPILLTQKDSVPEKVKAYINGKQIDNTYVIGGTGVIGDNVKNLFSNAKRLGGRDRYETNVLVMQEFASQLSFTDLYLAVGEGPNGNEFADALSGAVLAAQTSSPVVLTCGMLPEVTANFIKSKVSVASRASVLGGEAVVPSSLVDIIASYVGLVKISAKYDKAGTYGTAQGMDTISGNVVISAADVILQNTTIEGDLLLTEEIGNGNVTLKNVTVKGTTTVRGGGPNSVIMYNFNGQNVVVDVPDGGNVRLVAQGTTTVGSVTMNSDGKLEESGLTGSGFTTVAIPEGAQVVLSGTFDTVTVEASGANVSVASGSINTMNVAESASNAEINLAQGTSVATFTASAPVDVTGTGAITTANVKSDGVTIEQKPANTNVDNGLTASVGGTTVNGSPLAAPAAGGGGGGGGGDGSPSTISVSGVSISDAVSLIEVGATKQLSATITPDNATNKTVTWSTSDETLATVSNTGLVNAIRAGTATITATASGKTATCVITIKPAYTTTSTLSAWEDDRTPPKLWEIDNNNIITLETNTAPANNWYAWQGKKAFTNNAVTSDWKVETELELTEELLSRDGVRTSMWLNVQDTSAENIDWAILQFKIDNTNNVKGWQYWNSNGDGSWVDIANIPTIAGKYKLAIHFNNGAITQYINDKEVNRYTLGSELSSVKETIINSYSYGESYTAKWKVPTVKYVDKYPVGSKFISTNAGLDAAITNQKNGETWVIMAGNYDVKSKYRFDIDAAGDSKYNYYYFPIKANNLTIIGVGNPTIYSTDLTLNGVRATQNFISVYGNGVTIDGLKIMSKLGANKAIEVMGDKGGKNFTLKNSSIVKNTLVTYNGTDNVSDYFGKNAPIAADELEFAGSIYFNGDIGSSKIENVSLENSGISFGSASSNSNIAFNGVTINCSTATYAWVKNYKHSVNYTATVTGLDSITLVGCETKGEIVVTTSTVVDGIVTVDGVKYFEGYDAFNSIKTALDNAYKGDRIYVTKGTYDVTETHNNLIIDKDNISIIGAEGVDNLPTIKAAISGEGTKQQVILVRGNNVTLKNLKFAAEVQENKLVEIVGNNATIDSNVFTGNSIGLYIGVDNSAENKPITKYNVLNNTFTNSSLTICNGAGTGGSASDLKVIGNTFDASYITFTGITDDAWNKLEVDVYPTISGNTFRNPLISGNAGGKAFYIFAYAKDVAKLPTDEYLTALRDTNTLNATTVSVVSKKNDNEAFTRKYLIKAE